MPNILKGFYITAILLVLISSFFARTSNIWDRFLFDVLATTVANTETTDAIFIKVDEASIAEYGGWPWSRAIHADLINKLSAANLIVYDIAFVGVSADADADRQLDRVAANTPGLVLPILAQRDSKTGRLDTLFPFGNLKNNAFLGHVDMPLDVDQRFRSVYLKAGNANAQYPILGLAGLMALLDEAPVLQGVRPSHERRERSGLWTRDYANLLVPRVNISQLKQFNASDVLEGIVSPDFFVGKPVFVGIDASSLAKKPMLAGFDGKRFSDAEIQIEIFSALQNDTLLAQQNTTISFIYNALIVFLLLWLLYQPTKKWHRFALALLLFVMLFIGPLVLAVAFNRWLLQGHGLLLAVIIVAGYFLAKLQCFQPRSLPTVSDGMWQQHLKEASRQTFQQYIAVAIIEIDYFDRYQLDKDRQAVVKTYYAVRQLLQKTLAKQLLFVEPYEQTKLIALLHADETLDLEALLNNFPAQIEGLGIHHHSSTVGPYVSVSVGVSIDHHKDVNLLYVTDNADAALRQAIALGRNQTVLLN